MQQGSGPDSMEGEEAVEKKGVVDEAGSQLVLKQG